MSLYLKYRPQSLDEVYGNEATKKSLASMTKKGKKGPRVFLFSGPSGCGKTTLGRILVNDIGVKGTDLSEINSADFNGINTIRELRERMQWNPMQGEYRAFLMDEVHQLSAQAQDAMLKILEDTPSHIYFILCTTNPEKLKVAVRNRCQKFNVELLSVDGIKSLLKHILKKEKETLHKKVINQIAIDAKGHVREAIQLLEQALSVPEENQMEVVKNAAILESLSENLCLALMKGAPWSKIANILGGLKKEDNESIRRGVLGYASAVLVKGKANDKLGAIMEEFIDPFYNSGFPGLVYACYSVTRGGN